MSDVTLNSEIRPGTGQPPVPRRPVALTGLPMSFAQEQLWFIDEFHHGLPAHNVPSLVRMRGALDVAALGRALDRLAARHEALRTRLLAGVDGRPAQVVDPPEPVRLDFHDWAVQGPDTAELAQDTAAGRLREFAAAEALRPFHLAQDRLLRCHLLRLTPGEHVLLVVSHRAVFDDWSSRVLQRELAALYRAEASHGPDLPELPVQLADNALWERDHLQGSVLGDLEAYWRGELAGLETSRFPADRPRPLFASHNGAIEVSRTGSGLLDGLRKLSYRAGTTMAQTLLAALQVLLYRYTGQTDVVIGAASANRTRPELAPLIGSLANTLPIRSSLAGDPAFAELLERVRATAQSAQAHQELPFAQIVDSLQVQRDTGCFPVFQIGFAYCEPAEDIEAAGVSFRLDRAELRASQYDISFFAQPRDDRLVIEVTFTPVLFDAATVRRLLGNLEVLLAGAVADPSARLSQLPLLTDEELHSQLVEWNDTAAQFPALCIHQGIEAQAARAPDAAAAEFEDDRVCYRELNQQANQIARRLRAAGVGPEAVVGVCMRTGLRRLAGLLGIWKAGGGYLPLDPALPAERLSFMMADAALSVVLTDQPSMASVPPADGVHVLSLDADWPAISKLDDTDLTGTAVTPSNLAYVIYTSGSTGEPKGVVVEHRQAINFLQGVAGPWGIGPGSAVLAFAAFTFDVSVCDMFLPLLHGGRVVLAAPETLHSPPRLAALMREAEVTFACLPPAVLNLLTGEEFPDLRTLLSAGEELSTDLLRAWLRDGLDIFNGYGPTEASIGSTYMKLDISTPLPPPIGRPKPNYRVYVLDAYLNPVPVGVIGELHIGGAGVARGYLNRPELTRQRFIGDPFSAEPGARLYKSGDLVRRRADGTIVFAGRIDHQVKIRGLRIELGEIEAALTAHPAVAQAFVTVVTDPAGQPQLAAYLRASQATAPDLADIRQHLAAVLPAYMVPGSVTVLDRLPLTVNGKIDKAALPAPQSVLTDAPFVPPRTLLETALAEIYAGVLGCGPVSAADSFFDLGGNSLQAMQLIGRLRTDLAVDLDVTAVFLAPAPQQLAAVLRDEHGFDDAGLDEESIEGLAAMAEQARDRA
jgi:amino acid adenylation domain-containing protein